MIMCPVICIHQPDLPQSTGHNCVEQMWIIYKESENRQYQGGRTWQAFGRGKNGHETFRQARIYNFRDKCVVFARNLKFSNLTQ